MAPLRQPVYPQVVGRCARRSRRFTLNVCSRIQSWGSPRHPLFAVRKGVGLASLFGLERHAADARPRFFSSRTRWTWRTHDALWLCALLAFVPRACLGADLGREVAITRHLQDGDEFKLDLKDLLAHGQKIFKANWTRQEGGGRPLTKGNGSPLSDPNAPLVFPRNFNFVSGPDANSCAGCHNQPIPGGHGDIRANILILSQRFDFATLSSREAVPTKGAVDERGTNVTLQSIGDSRATVGMFGAGFIEMLARQMTDELRSIRDSLNPGESKPLLAKGVSFGRLGRHADGTWDLSKVEGIPAPSLDTNGAPNGPRLTIRPFHQVGNVISIRQFSNTALNHHHGIQTVERFGANTDPDGDGVVNELTRADVTAVTLFQATMAVPGRVIPNDPEIEAAVLVGEERFAAAGCVRCHLPSLPLDKNGWVFAEPSPFNPVGNLRPEDAPELSVDLTSEELPRPRLKPLGGVVHVPAFTDLKLHDICAGPDDPNREPIDMNEAAGSAGFFAGNRKFLTRKLWEVGGKPNYFHHGQFTTMREAILAHAGEADAERRAFEALSEYDRNCVIEFLKTLQVLPAGSPSLVVDEHGAPKVWPPNRISSVRRNGDQISLQWPGSTTLYQVQRVFQLQRSPAIDRGPWENIGAPTTNTAITEFIRDGAAFYRVVLMSK